jgi:electron transport complex protein RnfG
METGKLIVRYAFIMLAFAVVSGSILAVTHQLTEPKRQENLRKIEFAARKEIEPTAEKFLPAKAQNYSFLKAVDKNKKVVGYILKAVRRGYSSDVETLIAVNPDFSVEAIKILVQGETPGLGANVESPKFTSQFKHHLLQGLAVRKDGGTIDAITGATISSRAVADSVRQEIELFKKALKK